LRLFVLGLCALLALGLVAAASAARVQEGPRTPEAIRPCKSRGDGNKPQRLPSPVGARLGPLVIWPSIRSQVQAFGRGSGWAFYVKAPIVLPARSIVTLAVAPQAIHLIAFEASGYAVGAAAGRKWVSSVRFKACREDVRAYPRAYKGTVGKYTGFPFGFALAHRRMCVPLEVWVEGRTAPIRRMVPFGRRTCG
jgi:hypothetical protein